MKIFEKLEKTSLEVLNQNTMTTKLEKEFDIQDYLQNEKTDSDTFYRACREEDPEMTHSCVVLCQISPKRTA